MRTRTTAAKIRTAVLSLTTRPLVSAKRSKLRGCKLKPTSTIKLAKLPKSSLNRRWIVVNATGEMLRRRSSRSRSRSRIRCQRGEVLRRGDRIVKISCRCPRGTRSSRFEPVRVTRPAREKETSQRSSPIVTPLACARKKLTSVPLQLAANQALSGHSRELPHTWLSATRSWPLPLSCVSRASPPDVSDFG